MNLKKVNECSHPSYERVIDQDGHEYCGKCYQQFEDGEPIKKKE